MYVFLPVILIPCAYARQDSPAEVTLLRTTTGILSNRRPTSGTPITSGSATPSEPECSSTSRLSLLTMAKRESARRNLYSRFFRGPVLGPDVNPEMVNPSSKSADTPNAAGPSISIPEDLTKEKNEKKWRRKNEDDSLTKKEKKRKKPKLAKSPDKEEPKGTEAADTPEPTKTREETREERQARKAARAEKRKEREAKQKAKDELCKAKKERRKSREERKKLREERRREKLDKKNAKKGLI